MSKIIGAHASPNTQLVQRRLGRLRSELEFGDLKEIMDAGLHEYLDRFQQKLNAVDNAMNKCFFHVSSAAAMGDSQMQMEMPA